MNDVRVPHHRSWRSILILSLTLGTGLFVSSGPGTEAEAGGGSRKEAALVELGRRLFFDPLVSRSGSRACASCHQPDHGFSDDVRMSTDDVGRTVRHAQTLIDSHLNPNAHWDGEFPTIEAVITARIGLQARTRGYGLDQAPEKALNGGHSAVPFEADDIAGQDEAGRVVTPARGRGHGTRVERDPLRPREITTLDLDRLPRPSVVLDEGGRYRAAFRAAFAADRITRARIATAIAAYCRSLKASESPYDRYVKGDEAALSTAQRRGLALFEGKANCAACHSLEGRRAALSDYEFHNTGLAWRDYQARLEATGAEARHGILLDPGRNRVDDRGSHQRAFKTPTLRDVARRGPFMHSGAFATLAEVVQYYADGGSKDPLQEARITGFEVKEGEVRDLVAFLQALTGDERAGAATSCWHVRAKQMELRFEDASGKPLADMVVKLVPVGDAMPVPSRRGGAVLTRRTNQRGVVRVPPPPRTHYQLVLPNDVEPLNGSLVVDTCRKAVVVVPVKGYCSLALALPSDATAPKTLLAEHEGTFVLPGHKKPRTRFALTGVVRSGKLQVARYDGWLRSDVPPKVRIRVPGRSAATKPFTAELSGREPATIDAR